MPKTYDVIITRDTTESCTMLIEATSLEEANHIALARSYEDTDLVWEQDDTPNASKNHYVTSSDTTEGLGS